MNQEQSEMSGNLSPQMENSEPRDEILKETQLKFCSSLLTKLKRNQNAVPFLKPVDPIALGIPDYPLKIKNPMDISTIKHRIDTKYYQDPSEFHSDMTLMFNNCFSYNHPDSVVYKMGEDLQKAFESGYKEMPVEVAKKRKVEPMPSPVKPRRAAKSPEVMSPDDHARCSEVLVELEKPKHKKFTWPFIYPVTEADAPGYFTVITNPMDLSTVRTKVDTRKYSSFQEFINDLNLISENCFKFNSSETEVFKCGEEFKRLVTSLVSKEKDSDSRITELRKKISALTQELKILEQSSSKNIYTLDDRERIGKTIISMSKIQTEKIAEIVHRHCAYEYVDNDEIEINLQTMPDEVVAEIDEYVQKIKNGDAGDISTASDD